MDPVDQITEITQKLKEILLGYNIVCVQMSPRDQQIVYDIFLGKKPDINNSKAYSCAVLNYIGLYLEIVKNDKAEAKKYYRLAIDKGSGTAMSNYALVMESIGNIPEAKKYFLMAIDKGHVSAMTCYALILANEGKIPEATKYYLMAIDKGDSTAMNNYGMLLKGSGKIPEAKKYLLLSIDKGNAVAMYNYGGILKKEGNIPEAKKYLRMSMEKGDFESFRKLHKIYKSEYCGDNSANIDEEFYEFLKIAFNNQEFKEKLCPMFRYHAEIYVSGLEYIDLHIQYSPDSSGAKQAKKDFTDRLVNLKAPTEVPTEVQPKDQPKDNK